MTTSSARHAGMQAPDGSMSRSRPAKRCRALAAFAFAALVVAGSTLAQSPERQRAPGDRVEAPALAEHVEGLALHQFDALASLSDSDLDFVEASLKEGPSPSNTGPNTYRTDPRWGANGVAEDRFAGANEGRYSGRAVAQLSTGQIVVAALNDWPSVGTQLGLVKLNGRGQRQVWTAAGGYGHYGDQYIRYPNSTTEQPQIYSVDDMKIGPNDGIYVLVTREFIESGQTRFAPAILFFRPNGSFGGWWTFTPDGQRDNDGVAMDIRGDRMVVVGRRADPAMVNGGFWTMRLTIDSNGSLTLVPGSITVFSTPGGYGESKPGGVAFRRSTILLPPVGEVGFYVAFTARTPASAPYYTSCLTRITSGNQIDTGYGSGGVSCHSINGLFGQSDEVIDLESVGFLSGTNYIEDVFMLTRETRLYKDGFGILKLRDGVPNPTFGPSGGNTYGGCTAATNGVGEGCMPNLVPFAARTHEPLALALGANTLGVVGVSVGPGDPMVLGSGTHSWFAQINATNGTLNHLRRVQPSAFASPHQLWGVVHVGSNRYVATGETRIDGVGNAASRTMFTTRLAATSDIIYFDGFQD
ncbi:hypothetical protein [Pseudofulvimonas gallinarii]|uniref:Delta-60 repeat protein n=1 Tax=Pseudofulvimonas gallinarii TaxID=634155 RepID=A0A4V2UWS6_9GAMM|nr:hypothetical protein [Pseudofulvimonas gallinarii]TCT00788.1 hypothetical protein EDC25_102153 [Pseudofulvimonas gallinarii]